MPIDVREKHEIPFEASPKAGTECYTVLSFANIYLGNEQSV